MLPSARPNSARCIYSSLPAACAGSGDIAVPLEAPCLALAQTGGARLFKASGASKAVEVVVVPAMRGSTAKHPDKVAPVDDERRPASDEITPDAAPPRADLATLVVQVQTPPTRTTITSIAAWKSATGTGDTVCVR